MTTQEQKKLLDEYRDNKYHKHMAFNDISKKAFQDAVELLWPLVEGLEFACENRCNAEYNPCNARQALSDLEKKLRGDL